MTSAEIRSILEATEGIEVLPPATAADIEAFEAEHAIALPEAFRRFLLEVAGGLVLEGEPWLYSLAQIGEQLEGDGTDPAAPFPYDGATGAAILVAMRTGKAAGNVFTPEVMALQKGGSPAGCLTLACNGGNDFSVIVVSGELRGQMWRTGELDSPEVQDVYKPHPTDEPLDFDAWLPLWSECFLGVDWPV